MIERRTFIKALGAGTLAGALGAGLPRMALAQAGGKTLRLFTTTNLVSLDPVSSTAEIAVQHGYHVFDTLFGTDKDLKVHPQMASGHETSADGLTWTIRLREGLKFHDGAAVTSEDCVASIERWSKIDGFGRLLAEAVESYSSPDASSFAIKLKHPFPRLLEALGKPHSSPCFMMPARLARQEAAAPVTEMIGSGPFRFVAAEFVSGSKAVYEKFADYVPRDEPPSWTAGGKKAVVDRVEWVINTDGATGLNPLLQGEVDILQYLSADLLPLVEGVDGVAVKPFSGQVPIIRFNSTTAPFQNPAIRKIVAKLVSQPDFLGAVTNGNADAYRECKAVYPCGLPGVEDVASNVYGSLAGKLEEAKAELEAAGYKGEKVVILNPVGMADISTWSNILADVLGRAGFTVELADMDWGTMLERRRSRASSDQGGWSIFCSLWPTVAIANPALNITMRGDGDAGYAGWYKNDQLEALIDKWLVAADDASANATFLEIQKTLANEFPTVPLGLFYRQLAARSDVTGLDPAPVIYPWLIDKA